jgi:hypothetical protein
MNIIYLEIAKFDGRSTLAIGRFRGRRRRRFRPSLVPPVDVSPPHNGKRVLNAVIHSVTFRQLCPYFLMFQVFVSEDCMDPYFTLGPDPI